MTRTNLRFTSQSGIYVALVPHEALNPRGRPIGFTVVVTADGVARFASSWPCSHLGHSPIRFEYDSAGNLVDVQGEPKHADGGAMVALSEDAQRFGEGVIERRRAHFWPRDNV